MTYYAAGDNARIAVPPMSQHCLRVALAVALTSSGIAAAQPAEQPAQPFPAPEFATRQAQPTEQPPTNLAFWFGHVESDNIARTATPEDGSYESLGLLADFARNSQRFDADIHADLESRSYSLDTLDSEIVGTLNAGAAVHIIPQRFSWEFNDYHGQGITDPYAAIGPGNREQLNVFTTGPSVDLPLGARTSLELGATLSRRRFDETAVDSDSKLTEIGVHRQTSTTARLGLVVSTDKVEYVDVLAPEYDIDKLLVRYEKQLATGRVRADVGTNEISTGNFKSDGPLYYFIWTRSLTSRSGLSVRAGQELTDAGGALIEGLNPGLEGSSFPDVVVTPSPLEQRRLSVSYELAMSRTTVNAGIGSYADDYFSGNAADNDWKTLHLSALRTISPKLNVGLDYDRVDREFGDITQPDSTDSWTGLWVNRAIGQRLFFGVVILMYDRSSVDSYDELRYELRFGYTPTRSQARAMASAGR
ncbi:MAG TPA: hypothetical protein VGL98_08185 [Gammaproteobacteria bacterium]